MAGPEASTEAPVQTPAAPAPEAPAAPAPEPSDDFKVDEAQLAALPPEIRQSVVDPLIDKFKGYTVERLKKEQDKVSKKYETEVQKARALERLVDNPAFQRWYLEQQKGPSAAPAPAGAPKPAVSNEEWAAAYEKAAQGDLNPLNSLQEKQLDSLVMQKYAPVIQQVQAKTKELELTMEMDALFKAHPDAEELDSIRVNPEDPKSPSLLEMALHYVSDKGGKPFEEAYNAARQMADQMNASAKSAAMGMVKGKKEAVTETPEHNQVREEDVVYVDTPGEALRQQLQASLKGQNITYRVRSRGK